MKRYCKRGHDKLLPHGIIYRWNENRLVSGCAVCSRERQLRYWHLNREFNRRRYRLKRMWTEEVAAACLHDFRAGGFPASERRVIC